VRLIRPCVICNDLGTVPGGGRCPACRPEDTRARGMLAAMTDDFTGWRISRTCDGGACVEVGGRPGTVAVRDSADPDGPILAVSAASWREFTAALKAA
jgi:Domain of unknown function (DUF397)